MDPEWLKLIVRGTREGGADTGGTGSKLLTFVGLGVSILTLVLLFYVIFRSQMKYKKYDKYIKYKNMNNKIIYKI